MKKVIVTGASGFVGGAVVRCLLDKGIQVVALMRDPSKFELQAHDPRLLKVKLPVNNLASFKLEQALSPDSSLIHCAWSGVLGAERNDRSQLENINLTLELMEFAKLNGISNFVGVGSQAEYGPKSGLISETELLSPTHLYGSSKAAAFYAAEGLAKSLGIDFSWARIFSVYGPDDSPKWLIPSVIDSIQRGERPLLTAGEQLWDYLYVNDAAEALVALASLSSGLGAVNLGSGRTVQVRSLVETIRNQVKPEMQLVFGDQPYREDQVMHLQADITKLRQATGWSPSTSLEEGLKLTIQSRLHRFASHGQ